MLQMASMEWMEELIALAEAATDEAERERLMPEAALEANLVARDSRQATRAPAYKDPRGGDTRSAKYRAAPGGLPDWRDGEPPTIDLHAPLRISGQLRRVEHYVGQRALHEAVRLERMYWLDRLEARLAEVEASADNVPVAEDLDQNRRLDRYSLMEEIARLRRCLAVKKTETDDQRRVAVRERVRRHRARAKARRDP
jgi:hypothetical protein